MKFKWHRERRQNLEEQSILNLLTKFQKRQQVFYYWYSSPVWKIVTVANIYCIVAFSFDFEQLSRHSIPEGSFFIASKPFKTVNSNGLRQIPCLVRTIYDCSLGFPSLSCIHARVVFYHTDGNWIQTRPCWESRSL